MPLAPARMALPGEALDSIARYPAVSDARLESDAERTVGNDGSYRMADGRDAVSR
jgi:hypothetical protein